MSIKPIIEFRGVIEKGKVVLENQEALDKHVSTFNEGDEIRMMVKKYKGTRKMSQNRLYWLYLRVIEEDTGDYIMDLHEFFKNKLLPPRFVKIMKEEVKLPPTTKELKTDEFGEYMLKIESLTGIPMPYIKYEQ